jgi:small-conductance mechanosensitive channel
MTVFQCTIGNHPHKPITGSRNGWPRNEVQAMNDWLNSLLGQVALWLPHAGMALLVMAAFWMVSIAADRAIGRLSVFIRADTRDLLDLVRKTSRVALVLFGLVSALGTLGVNVLALVAGLGLTGFALGFALKDALSNLLAGALILIYRPIRYRDRITVAGFEGTVVQVDLRYTVLEREGQRILIPNAVLFTNPITITSSTQEVGVGEQRDTEQA